MHAPIDVYKGVPKSDAYTSYGAEWLLDNYYVVQRAIREVDEDMPSQFYDELPILEAPAEAQGLSPRLTPWPLISSKGVRQALIRTN